MDEIEMHYGPTPEIDPEEGALWFATTSGLLHEFEGGHWRPATPQTWGRAFRALNENALSMAAMMIQAFRMADAAVDIARNSTGVAGWHEDGSVAPWDTFRPDLKSKAVDEFLKTARPLVHRCEDALRGMLPDHNTERCAEAPEVGDVYGRHKPTELWPDAGCWCFASHPDDLRVWKPRIEGLVLDKITAVQAAEMALKAYGRDAWIAQLLRHDDRPGEYVFSSAMRAEVVLAAAGRQQGGHDGDG